MLEADASGKHGYKKITDALAVATDGDEVLIHPGTYSNETFPVVQPTGVTVNCPAGPSNTRLDYSAQTGDDITVWQFNSRNRLTGLRLYGYAFSGHYASSAFKVPDGKNDIHIEDCEAVHVAGTDSTGFHIVGTTRSCYIKNCRLGNYMDYGVRAEALDSWSQLVIDGLTGFADTSMNINKAIIKIGGYGFRQIRGVQWESNIHTVKGGIFLDNSGDYAYSQISNCRLYLSSGGTACPDCIRVNNSKDTYITDVICQSNDSGYGVKILGTNTRVWWNGGVLRSKSIASSCCLIMNGDDCHYVEALSEQSTTSESFQSALSTTPPAGLPASQVYDIDLDFETYTDTTEKWVEVELRNSSGNTLGVWRGEAVSYSAGHIRYTGSTNIGGGYALSVHFRCAASGMTAYIRNIRVSYRYRPKESV